MTDFTSLHFLSHSASQTSFQNALFDVTKKEMGASVVNIIKKGLMVKHHSNRQTVNISKSNGCVLSPPKCLTWNVIHLNMFNSNFLN